MVHRKCSSNSKSTMFCYFQQFLDIVSSPLKVIWVNDSKIKIFFLFSLILWIWRMTHTTSHRDLAPGKNNFDSSRFYFGFYLVILAINKVFAVHADQNGPGTAWSYHKMLFRFFGTKFESHTKNLQAVFWDFLTCMTIFMNHFETDLRL